MQSDLFCTIKTIFLGKKFVVLFDQTSFMSVQLKLARMA